MIALVIRQRVAIVGLESRLDQSDAEKAEKKKLHDLFGKFMAEGENLAKELKNAHGHAFGPWLRKRQIWAEQVVQTLDNMNLQTEAASFRHAGEKDPLVGPGIVPDDRYWYRLYQDQLTGYRNKIQEIVTRRLPN
jgi:hypothetical protein